MDEAPNNPTSNRLGPGLTEDQVHTAVEKSGYPLQTVVADLLRATPSAADPFFVSEEWCFLDRQTKELRTLDLNAELRLHGWDPQPRVRPTLNLLVECKQSALPFVFFLTRATPKLLDFPRVAGLRADRVIVTSDDDPSSWTLSIIHVLDLDEDPFQQLPRFSHTLSKCVRKGSEVELSGSEAYNTLVLPLVKALQHYVNAEEPVDTAYYFDSHLAVAVAVLDAPMIGVSVEAATPRLTGVPWVRVLRHEYAEEAQPFERNRVWVMDVVHKDYFRAYLEENLLPFARRFAERVLRHPTELATGLGFASGMGVDGWRNFEPRLSPRSLGTRTSRIRAAGRRVRRLLTKTRDRDEE